MAQTDILFDDDEPEPALDLRQLTKSEQKLQRWVDLLAALLIRHRHATFEELAKDVPGYDLAHGQRESVLRTFERDKDELRRFGVPIDTVRDGQGEPLGYRIERKGFYLPFLMVAGHERAAHAAVVKSHDGYRSLETLAFEPDEIDAITQAATRVRALGDPVLADEAEAAMRKLALDLPLGVAVETDTLAAGVVSELHVLAPRRPPDVGVFERLSDALARRKVVSFDYYTMERGERARRSVEPYGLFFVSSHWYLAGRDVAKDGIRNFRLSRITRVQVNTKTAQSADYEIPPTFALRDHAQAREPWEIGDGDAMAVIVEFTATTGATKAALALGQAIGGSETRRRFTVRRLDAFARWLLSFGGDARPVEPPDLRAEYERVAAQTLRRYANLPDDDEGGREASTP
ncbi:MAG TPA: WYL domain-containing protein [Gemmatimonadaceae bacterium]|jgi:predicted DNA-binding transcriptional regulator YafY|nr:WYL domain-containing protein [Gemmatimonadaceae bacterium]